MSITDPQAERWTGADISPVELAAAAARALDSKQGRGIVILDVGELLGIVDLFVIASGGSKRQVRTLAEEVEIQLKRRGRPPLRREGLDAGDWVLLDYGDAAVHIFGPEAREFYSLERLWGDAPRLPWTPGPSEGADEQAAPVGKIEPPQGL